MAETAGIRVEFRESVVLDVDSGVVRTMLVPTGDPDKYFRTSLTFDGDDVEKGERGFHEALKGAGLDNLPIQSRLSPTGKAEKFVENPRPVFLTCSNSFVGGPQPLMATHQPLARA